MSEFSSKLIIIGSGPAGYTAGIYAARAGLNPILISGNQIGGQLTMTTAIENFPGFCDPITGPELMENMKKQALNSGVKIIDDKITEVDFINHPFVLSSENGNSFTAQSIIIATGSSAKWLELDSEKKYIGFGVSACATCDGFFYKNKIVAVVGGGNSAAEEALYLTNFAQKVILIHRRDMLRADALMQKRLKNNPKISIMYDSIIKEIIGTETPKSVNEIVIKNVKTDNVQTLQVDGVFVAIGHKPNTEIFREYLELDETGYIKTKPESTQTNVDGVFAAGDVKDPRFRQAITAAGSGAMAAMEAAKYLSQINQQ
ncbi:MAG: thioredoxin-disulfide reductase [Alphaproteobacteria bacterium]|nr:thioredoxin-disulfide reductase [Alphaproteobacteria bacterium]